MVGTLPGALAPCIAQQAPTPQQVIYLSICICVCICKCICMHVFMGFAGCFSSLHRAATPTPQQVIHIYIYRHVYMYTYMHVHTFIYVHVCIHVHVHVRKRTCLPPCIASCMEQQVLHQNNRLVV